VAVVLVDHGVVDLDRWLAVLDETAVSRQANGGRHVQVFHSKQDPLKVATVFAWDSLENGRIYLEDMKITDTLRKLGSEGPIAISYLIEG
jgi:hypothetical protein